MVHMRSSYQSEILFFKPADYINLVYEIIIYLETWFLFWVELFLSFHNVRNLYINVFNFK